MKRVVFLLLVLTLVGASSVNAQISKGKIFWFGFMQNYLGGATDYRVYITSEVPTTGVISSPLQGWSQNFTVTPGVSTLVTVPVNVAENTTADGVSRHALKVVTDECVSVFAHNYQPYTSDAEVIFPVNSLGNEYIVTTWFETQYNIAEPELLIAAAEGPTQLSITLPVSTQGHTAGVPYTVTLDTGEVYQLKSTNGDLTGTTIRSLDGKNFATFGGHVCANVVCVACDHICEQMYPVSTWGTEYITIPLQTRPYDVFRIVASANGTQYRVNGGAPVNLNANQFSEIRLNAVSTITSNYPISVAQYSIGAGCNTNGSEDGDPFVIMLSPTSQSINQVTFNALPSSQALTYYLNIVAKTADLSTVTLDGTNIASSFATVASNPTYSSASIIISQADHTLKSNMGTQASVYAYGWYESFGYSAGVRVQIPFLSVYDTTKLYCPGDTVFISLNTPDSNRIIYTEWDLGDGSPRLYDTMSFWHVYNNYGKYPVTLIYEMLGACVKDTITIDTIKILGPEPNLGGPFSFCTAQNISLKATYKITPDTLIYTMGGNTITTTDTNYTFNFFASQDTVVYLHMKSAICDGYDTARIYVAHDTAGFTFNNACADLPVNFVNTSQVIPNINYTWNWDFGDGTGSIAKSTTHQYAAGGTYNVKLTLSSPSGCTDSIIQPVTVYSKPRTGFIASHICNDSVLTPIDTTTIVNGTITRQWIWGDGSIDTTTNPSHTYTQSGAYLVTLIAEAPGCADTFKRLINVNIGTDMMFEGVNVCMGNQSLFTDNSINNSGSAVLYYSWDFGDGFTDTGTTVTHTYLAPGMYMVKLLHELGAECFDSIILPYYVHPVPVADFIVSDLCNTGTTTPINNTTITPAGTVTYSWLFGDSTAAEPGNSPPHTYALSGTYNIQLIAVSDSGCADTVTYPINVIRGTTPAFNTSPVCEGAATVFTDQTANPYNTTINSYTWDFGDGTGSTQQNPTHQYPALGTYNAWLRLDYGSNCADSVMQQVTVYPIPAASFVVTDICNDSIVTPVNTSTYAGSTITYTWDFGDGTTAATGNNPPHTYALSNNYNIQLIATGTGGCADTATNPVNVIKGTIISFTAPAVCEGATNIFTDATSNPYNTNITGYTWTFGDGGFAMQQNTTYTYATAGTYSVQLKLDYGNNCADSVTQQVMVNPNPVAGFTVADVCNDSIVTPVNNSTGATSYLWDFGDGSALVNGNNPAHTYQLSNNYTVKQVAITAFNCTDSTTNPVNVTIGTNIAFNVTNICEGAVATFTDQTTNPYNTTITGYVWSFGDGNGDTQQNTQHTYAAAGNYNVQLRVDYNNNCADSLTQPVTVNANPVADFTVDTPCTGEPMQYTDASTAPNTITNYLWQFGDGDTSTLQNPSHVFPAAGSFNTTLLVTTQTGCIDTTTKSVTVLFTGTAQFGAAPVCLGDSTLFYSTVDTITTPVVNYVWQLGENGAVSPDVNPIHEYSAPGIYSITLITIFNNGCIDTATGTTEVFALPVISATVNNVSCFAGSDGSILVTPVSGEPNFNYVWSNTQTNTANNQNLTIGDYTVTVTDGNTCTVTGAYTVTEPTQLLTDTSSSPISCFGYADGGLVVTPNGATPPYSYLWSNGEVNNAISVAAGTYTVTVTDALGCSVSVSMALSDPPLFVVELPETVTVDLGNTIQLSPGYQNGNPVNWQWIPETNLNCANCQNTEVSTYLNTFYTVTATTDLGCVATAAVQIIVNPKRQVFIPNVFTPNADGANDYFEVFGNKEAWKQFEVQVFNRIGEKVFESNDINFKWDGTYKGVLQNNGVFVYVIKLVYLDNVTENQYKGSLTLLR